MQQACHPPLYLRRGRPGTGESRRRAACRGTCVSPTQSTPNCHPPPMQGHDFDALWRQIAHIIVKSVIACQPMLQYQVRCGSNAWCMPRGMLCSACHLQVFRRRTMKRVASLLPSRPPVLSTSAQPKQTTTGLPASRQVPGTPPPPSPHRTWGARQAMCTASRLVCTVGSTGALCPSCNLRKIPQRHLPAAAGLRCADRRGPAPMAAGGVMSGGMGGCQEAL